MKNTFKWNKLLTKYTKLNHKNVANEPISNLGEQPKDSTVTNLNSKSDVITNELLHWLLGIIFAIIFLVIGVMIYINTPRKAPKTKFAENSVILSKSSESSKPTESKANDSKEVTPSSETPPSSTSASTAPTMEKSEPSSETISGGFVAILIGTNGNANLSKNFATLSEAQTWATSNLDGTTYNNYTISSQ